MTLYRVQESFSTSAYSRLGSLYLEAGRPLAVIYLAAAVDAVLTREIAEIEVDEPDYAYKSLSDLVARIGGDKAMSRFAEESGLWRDMVLLGEALAQEGYRDTARELWSAVLLRFGPAETWGKRAARDIKNSRSASKGP